VEQGCVFFDDQSPFGIADLHHLLRLDDLVFVEELSFHNQNVVLGKDYIFLARSEVHLIYEFCGIITLEILGVRDCIFD